jgi:hypothetical protein
MKTRIVQEWALAKHDGECLYKTITLGYRVDEWDERYEPAYCRLSMTFETRAEAEKFAKQLAGLASPA